MEFITQLEQDRLRERLNELIGRRPAIRQRIADARALGDLRENGDYHAAREEQGMDEAEITRLEKRLAAARVVGESSTPSDVVFLGATVKIREVGTDDEEMVRLVGEPSGDMMADPVEVSISSPMGEALLKARVGETVRVDTPRGTKRFEVLQIG
jgi:transcription elongation factor GreA